MTTKPTTPNASPATPDFSNLSTFQLAFAAGVKLTNLRQKSSPKGRIYFVDVEGETMPASEARTLLVQQITDRQRAAGLFK